jgi:hypothetical protein
MNKVLSLNWTFAGLSAGKGAANTLPKSAMHAAMKYSLATLFHEHAGLWLDGPRITTRELAPRTDFATTTRRNMESLHELQHEILAIL